VGQRCVRNTVVHDSLALTWRTSPEPARVKSPAAAGMGISLAAIRFPPSNQSQALFV